MAVFAYKARDRSGKLVSGQLEGRDQAFIATKVGEMGFIPVNIQPVSEQGAPPPMVWLSRKMHEYKNTVKLKELVYFSRQLGTLYGAGVPIQNSLTLLGEQTTNPYFQQIIREIVEQIKEGKNLSRAMAKFPKVFDELFVSLIESGESSGNLELVFDRLANL